MTFTDLTPPTATPPAAPAAAATGSGLLQQALEIYGLGSLAQWAWNKHNQGESDDQILSVDLPQTQEFKTRFPAYDTLAKQGHAMTPGQMVQYETAASQIFKAAGLPAGFYDSPDDFAKLMVNNVAAPELQQRVDMYKQAVYSEPPEVLDAWKNLYGMNEGDALAYYIDPTAALPLIQKKNAAAQAAGQANITGFGNLNQAQAEYVGNIIGTGPGAEGAAATQFGKLALDSEVYNPLVGSGETAIGKDVAIGAGFGQNAQDQAIIDQRKRARLAQFGGGGGVATTQQGASGAGTAQ